MQRWGTLALASALFIGSAAFVSAQSTAPQSAPPTITGPASISAETGKALTVSFTATNNPNQYMIRGGTVPPGLHMDLMAGRLEGAPTATGTYQLDLAAANSGSSGSQWSATFTTTITVVTGNSPPTTPAEITGPGIVSGQVGRPLSVTLATTRPALHFEMRSGSFPPGTGFESMSGTISGTPTTAGTFVLNVVAVSQGSNGQQYSTPYAVTFAISADGSTPPPPAQPAPVITAPASASGTVGQPFSLAYVATNSPTSYHIEYGGVPPGTQWDATAGTIKGTPTQAGTFRLDVVAHNLSSGVSQSSARFPTTIAIAAAGTASNPPPSGTTTLSPTGTPTPPAAPEVTGPFSATGKVGEAFSLIVSARNNPTQFAIRGGTTPQGLIVDTGSTLVFRGTPAQVGQFTLSVVAGNSGSGGAVQWSAPATLTITIADADGLPAPVITGPFSATGAVGRPFSVTFSASNKPLAFGLSGPTPPGLKLDYYGGILSGTPSERGNFTSSVMAENTGPNGLRQWSAPASVTIAIGADTNPPPPPPPPTNPAAPAITSAAEASGQMGQAFTFALTASNNPTQFAIRTGTLQPGLALDPASGRITGTPQVAGTATVEVAAANAGPNGLLWGQSSPFRITVAAAPAPAAPVVSGPATALGMVGKYFSLTFNASNQPRQYEIRGGSVPPGLHMDLMAGAIVGTPTQAGAFKLDVAAGNQGANGTQWSPTFSVLLTIAPAVPVPATTLVVDVGATAGTPNSSPTAVPGSSASASSTTTATTTPAGTATPPATSTTPAATSSASNPSPASSATANSSGTTSTPVSAPAPAADASQLSNISARMEIAESDPGKAFITGFVVAGDQPRRVLVRATGPALATFGIEHVLANPGLRITDANGRVVAENDDWRDESIAAVARTVGAFPLQSGAGDAAAVLTLEPGAYSMQVMPNGGSGVALAEVFAANDAAASGASMINVSTRGFVGRGEAQLTTGFVISGHAPKRVLLRAVGPSLTAFGVGDALADPVLTLHRGTTSIAQNDNWETVGAPSSAGVSLGNANEIAAASAAFGAFSLASGSRDSALLVELAPGAYTATVSGADGGSGSALVEVYEVKPAHE